MKTFPILAAVILTTAPAYAQDDLDSLKGTLQAPATPTPAAASTAAPKPAAQVQQATPHAATMTRSTPAAHAEAKPDLSRARFVQEGDLAALAGQKLDGNTYLIGTYKATGSKMSGRYEFTTRTIVLGSVIRGSTRILVRFPSAPNPQLLAAGNSSQWDRKGPLHLERVEKSDGGTTAYATDTP